MTALLAAERTHEPAPIRDVPRSWHEAWLDAADGPFGQSDVPDLTRGVWPASCNDRHEWLLATAKGTRPATTWCTRRAFHTGRHAQGQVIADFAGTLIRGRVIAVWEYAP